MISQAILLEDQWDTISQFLPASLDEHARYHGAMRRKRGQISSAEQLLRVLLMHIGGGLSLEQTVARAAERGLATLNAMALHKRLCTSGAWLSALTSHVLGSIKPMLAQSNAGLSTSRCVRILDATVICEPGSTGTDWRLHYSLRLPDLCCDFYELTDVTGAESARRLDTGSNDLVLLDRGYSDRRAIAQLMDTGAAVIVRWRTSFPLTDAAGRKIKLLSRLRKLRPGQREEWPVWFEDRSGGRRQMRVCALAKSPGAAQLSRRKMLRKARGKAARIRPDTLEYANYIIVLTNLPPEEMQTGAVLEYYRARWQVELAFKRLKSLLDLGQLPKKKEASSIAWMQGKILCALIIERLLCEARFFSPWGYPLR